MTSCMRALALLTVISVISRAARALSSFSSERRRRTELLRLSAEEESVIAIILLFNPAISPLMIMMEIVFFSLIMATLLDEVDEVRYKWLPGWFTVNRQKWNTPPPTSVPEVTVIQEEDVPQWLLIVTAVALSAIAISLVIGVCCLLVFYLKHSLHLKKQEHEVEAAEAEILKIKTEKEKQYIPSQDDLVTLVKEILEEERDK